MTFWALSEMAHYLVVTCLLLLITADDDEITRRKVLEVVSYVHQEEMGDSGNSICLGL